MSQEIMYVIGDNFKSFSKLENVMTYSRLLERVKEKDFEYLKKFHFMVGQGVNKIERIKLRELSQKNQIGFVINAHQKPASNSLTHKHKNENIVVTEPLVLVNMKLYCAYLAIDDSCAEMSDHVTGLHIQGMVLTEAARQMMLAVAEKYILNANEKGNFYCVLNKISSQFNHFAFPVDMKIEHEILELIDIERKGYEAKTRTNFLQNNKVITHVDIDYKFHEKTILESIENKMAARTLKSNVTFQIDNLYLETVA